MHATKQLLEGKCGWRAEHKGGIFHNLLPVLQLTPKTWSQGGIDWVNTHKSMMCLFSDQQEPKQGLL